MNATTAQQQRIIVGDEFIYFDNTGDIVSGDDASGNFSGGVANTFTNGVLTAGQFTAYDPYTRKGVDPATTIPDEVIFAGYYEYNAGQASFVESPVIRKGDVISYTTSAYSAFVPMAIAVKLGANPVVGEQVSYTIKFLTYNNVFKYDIIGTYRFTSTSIGTELTAIAAQINASVTEQYKGYKPFTAVQQTQGGVPTLLLITNPVTTDFKNIIPEAFPIIDMFLSSSIDINNEQTDGWVALFPAVTKTKGNYTGGTFTGFTWTGGTYNVGLNGNPGSGTPVQVKSHYWSGDLGARGKANRVGFVPQPYDPTGVAVSYKVYTVHFRQSFTTFDRGGVVGANQAILTIYVDSTYTDIADWETFFNTLMAGLVG